MIITLAGHVDHGKTSLVQALTGVNTDRLTEEKRRGLTIDLGFAYLGSGKERLGFVDVPGHHRFIHNMVAGVSADQHALLVIAADDGPMPQSLEHLQILELIGIREGTVALTKCDRVTDEQRADARARTEALLANSCLADAEIIETSVTSGEGLEALRSRLTGAAVHKTARTDAGAFRMPIDRAFTISGAGVVVTGTVHDGRVQADDSLVLFPEGREVRVKSIRAQDEAAVDATVGERAALNLAGVEQSDVRRGQWLTSATDEASAEFSLSLNVLDDYPRSIRHWLPVHVYFATSHTTGHVALLSAERVAPGEEALVELVTAEKLLLRRGDRIVLRDQGLDRTLGGGRVVSVQPAGGRRRADDRLARLSADRASDPSVSLAAHLDVGAVDLAAFRRNWGLDEAATSALLAAADCREVEGHAVRGETWKAWKAALQQDIERRHREDTALQGLKLSELPVEPPPRFHPALLTELVTEGALVAKAGRFQPTAHEAALSPGEQQWWDRVGPLLDQPQPPSLGDMAKQFRLGVGDLAKRLHPLVTKKLMVRISDTRYYLPEHLERLAMLAERLAEEAPFTVRQYRDAAEIGRNVAIEVLEHFDRVGFTRRDADVRRVIGERARIR